MLLSRVYTSDVSTCTSGSPKACGANAKESITAKLKNFIGKDIILGVRPEDVFLETDKKAGDSPIQAIIEVIEPMGSENYLYLRADDFNFVIKTIPSLDLKINQRISLMVNLANIQLFDKQSSESLLS